MGWGGGKGGREEKREEKTDTQVNRIIHLDLQTKAKIDKDAAVQCSLTSISPTSLLLKLFFLSHWTAPVSLLWTVPFPLTVSVPFSMLFSQETEALFWDLKTWLFLWRWGRCFYLPATWYIPIILILGRPRQEHCLKAAWDIQLGHTARLPETSMTSTTSSSSTTTTFPAIPERQGAHPNKNQKIK